VIWLVARGTTGTSASSLSHGKLEGKRKSSNGSCQGGRGQEPVGQEEPPESNAGRLAERGINQEVNVCGGSGRFGRPDEPRRFKDHDKGWNQNKSSHPSV